MLSVEGGLRTDPLSPTDISDRHQRNLVNSSSWRLIRLHLHLYVTDPRDGTIQEEADDEGARC